MLIGVKEYFRLLYKSAKNIIRFELTYKFVAVALIYPMIIFVMNAGMKVANIRYLTNEYIYRALTDPFIIFLAVMVVLLFVLYCTYEMSYLAVCFETERTHRNASVIDNMYNAFRRFKKLLRLQSIPLFIIYFIFIIFVNVTIVLTIFYSETTFTMFHIYILRNTFWIKFALLTLIPGLYVFVILGIFTFNIYVMEDRSFLRAFVKSAKMVRAHIVGTIFTIVFYNLFIFLCIMLLYFIISVVLIVGVRILDMAYIGSAVYLSILRGVRAGVKLLLAFLAIPLSFSTISHLYYKYCRMEDITFEFVDIDEKKVKINKFIYYVVLISSILLDGIYMISVLNDNPFSKVAIFHDTQITAHRGASRDAPENTLAAFRRAMENMSDGVELDVQMSSDGVLVIMHDYSALRTTGVDRRISEMKYSEIRQLDAGAWFSPDYAGQKVPSLREAIELLAGKININIEIKPSGNGSEIAKKVVEMIEEYDIVDSCVVTSFDYQTLKAIKQFNKDVQVGYILSLAYGDFYEMDDVDFFSVNASFLTKRVVDAIHHSGKQVYAWTVNNETSIKNLTNKGVDNIITDDPVLARETVYSRDTSETIINMIKYVFNR